MLRFCFNDPPGGGSSKQVETAVVRGVYTIEVLKFVSSTRQNQRGGRSKVVLVVVEVLSVGSKPPAAVGESISKGKRHDLGTAAPLPTTASSREHRRAGGPVEPSQKLVEPFESGSTQFAEKLSHASLELL